MFRLQKKDRLEFWVNVILLFCFWFLITFPAEPFTLLGIKNLIEHIMLGLLFAFIITIIFPYTILSRKEIHEYMICSRLFKFSIYILRLIVDIIKAGIDVAKRVLRPTLLISPGIIEVETPLKDDIQIALNANSITLTPGTITIDVEKTPDGSKFLVHCISQDAVNDIRRDMGFVKRIQACFIKDDK